MDDTAGTIASSREAERWASTKATLGNEYLTLGPYFTFIVRNSPGRLLRMFSYYKFAAKMMGPGRSVVDIGCGEGFGTVMVAEHAHACVGIDLDADAIAVANATVASDKLSFEVGDVLAIRPGRFDAAVSLDVIEHIYKENEDAFVGNIAAALGPDGIFVLGTPNITSDQYSNEHTRRGHVNLFTAERLRELGLRHFKSVFVFSGNDEVVHTGFTPMAYYLLALCVGPRNPA